MSGGKRQSPAAASGGILTSRVPRLSDAELRALLADAWGLGGALRPLSGERDQNLRVTASDGNTYVLKIANAAEPVEALAFQVAALDHIAASDPSLPVPRTLRAKTGESLVPVAHDGATFMARLVTHLPGEPALAFAPTPEFRRAAGRLTGRLDRALADFRHPGGEQEMIWDLRHAAGLEDHIRHIADPERRAMAGRVMADFKARAVPVFGRLRMQVIHNDIHQNNIMREPRSGDISGIIDFGDMAETCLVNEAAIAVAHQLYREDDPLAVAAEFLGPYAGEMPLEAAEIAVLFDLVKMRLASREIIAAWRAATTEGPSPYRADISEMGWEALARCLAIDPDHATTYLEKAMTASATAKVPANTNDAAFDALMARRRAAMGPMYKEFYRQPFMPVKGDGVFVTDANGKRYLDGYNNVPHVGHCHSHVANAVTRRVNTFNSNTRYPSDVIVSYAERLLSTLPDYLDTAMFVCSGTEANELAWRIATANTGATGALVTDAAFHGNSTIIGALDTATIPHDRVQPFVGMASAPKVPGAAGGGAPLSAEDYAATWRGAIEGLAGRGHRPAALFVCPVFASDGLYSAPAGYLDPAMAAIRKAGALVIADEVQTALGRTGTHFWGFEHAGFVPDMVTMGKPMGNGIPLGVVVARRALVEGFLETQRYFNTFGGNQVAAAAGLAVLDVMENEKLQDNALNVGAHLRENLAGLMKRHAAVGDVRGTGLFAGVEIVRDGKASPDTARAVIEDLLARGVLVGITGAGRNLLKIRPPMCFSKDNADMLVDALDKALAKVG